MKSYNIQHDYLFVSTQMASEGTASFDVPKSKADLKRATPVKASIFLGEDGEEIYKCLTAAKRPILLIDDLPKSDNPIISAYAAALVKGISAKFRDDGLRVFKK